MEKHTKEYAEKLAKLKFIDQSYWIGSGPTLRKYDPDHVRRVCFKDGYIKAVEETNVIELLEACNKAFILCDKLQMPTESELNELKNVLNNAIKKATE